MIAVAKSRNALEGKIINLRRGLAVYRVKASPYYRVRIWIPSKKKRVVRTSKATTRTEAISVAEELFSAMGTRGQLADTPKDKTFEHFADRLVTSEKSKGRNGKISGLQAGNTESILRNDRKGQIQFFGKRDIREIQTKDFLAYMSWVREKEPSLSAGTLNHFAVVFRKVMSLAQSEGIIDAVPPTPREKRKDNPRAFFRFKPLVTADKDEYALLLKTAKVMASEHIIVRGTPITSELYDFILFLTHSFLRPTLSEIYALTHQDITTATDPKRLIITVANGKTGYRVSNTMPAAVTIYERTKKRHEGTTKDDYLFLPAYKNRAHAKRIIQRQFNAVLERAGLKQDRYAKSVHTVYSLRHTAICMRLVLSHGKVNIFNLAKNAGTSVDQIERFYARNLPQSAEMAWNLQSFGGRE